MNDKNRKVDVVITEKIHLSHGSGAGLHALLEEIIIPCLLPGDSGAREDAFIVDQVNGRLAFTTDSFVVDPLEFPGGNIGKLAACGTINDLAMMAAQPTHLAVSLIIEEGLEISSLQKYLRSLRSVCDECGVTICCGDTKVVDRGKADGLFITTSGIGVVAGNISMSAANARHGDSVIVSGPAGLHGTAILAQRKNLGFASQAISDCAPLNEPARALISAVPGTRVMRDATRGGIAAVLNEIAADSGVTIRL
ncbi:MAG: hydrogenase expression/formation protein HypE, partial [Chitinivibrionales bacterium]|nr:hydrogenase expression/formation protein HypE [Chitinivibrionales bacterium]